MEIIRDTPDILSLEKLYITLNVMTLVIPYNIKTSKYSMFPIKRTVFFTTVSVHKNTVRLIGNIEYYSYVSNTGGPLLTLFFETLEEQLGKQKTV